MIRLLTFLCCALLLLPMMAGAKTRNHTPSRPGKDVFPGVVIVKLHGIETELLVHLQFAGELDRWPNGGFLQVDRGSVYAKGSRLPRGW